ncbi:MAG: hypothetical protein SGPRY_003545 [Prymnesium sp.]
MRTGLCGDPQLSMRASSRNLPNSALFTAFDESYAPAAARLSDLSPTLGLPFFGFCADGACVRRFHAIRGNNRRAGDLLALCNASQRSSERLPSTERCRGWRRIQFVKVWGVHDVIAAGVSVLLLDGDRGKPSKPELQLMQRGDTRIDTFVSSRDPAPWPGFWNFGYAFMRATPVNQAILRSLSRLVAEHWDQAAWNFVMRAYEDRALFTCRPLQGRCGSDSCGRGEPRPEWTGRGSMHFLPSRANFLPHCPLVADQPLCLCGLEMRWNIQSWIGYLHDANPLSNQTPRCDRNVLVRNSALRANIIGANRFKETPTIRRNKQA